MKSTLLSIAIAVVLAGCADLNQKPIVLVAAVDVSCPKKELLARYGSELYRIQSRLSSDSRLDVYRFASSAELVYSGSPVFGRHAFNAKIGPLLAEPSPSLAALGTKPGSLLEAAAGSAERAPAVYVIITDGGVEDRSKEELASIGESLKAMASSRNTIGVAAVGVKPEHRLFWRGLLKPLGGKAVLKGLNDASEVPSLVSKWSEEGAR